MNSIQSYIDTKNELIIVKRRIRYLQDKREELYVSLVGVKGISFDGEAVTSPNTKDSKIIAFLHEYEEKKQLNGKSIAEELKALQSEEKRLSGLVEEMEVLLENMSGYEYQLFYHIAILRQKPKKAVEEVAKKNDMTERNIWRKYSRISSYVKELKR